MPCLGTTKTIQRVGMLDLSSLTERTIPVGDVPGSVEFLKRSALPTLSR